MLFKVDTTETLHKTYYVIAENKNEVRDILGRALCGDDYLSLYCREDIQFKDEELEEWYFDEIANMGVPKELLKSSIEKFAEKVPDWEDATMERFLWWLDSTPSDTPVDVDLYEIIEFARKKYNIIYLRELMDTLDEMGVLQ